MSVTIYNELEQGSQAWIDARCGLLTASVVGRLITPTLKLAENDTSRGLALTLAAERITGHVEYVYPSFEMQRGTDDEPYARDAYAAHFGVDVEEVGFITREFDRFILGFSPDGLVGTDGLIEIKSRNARAQLSTILADKVPTANMMQIQCGLFLTGRKWLDYVSYSQGLPLWTKRVTPDPTAFQAIFDAAWKFETDVNEIIAKYSSAVDGLPATERRPELGEMVI